jgi:hypothetical protein
MGLKLSTEQKNGQQKKDQPTQGLIQEVAIGEVLSEQLLQENQIKKG